MDTAIERIHAKIVELEARIADLRITERELRGLDQGPVRQARIVAEPEAMPRQKPGPKPILRSKIKGSRKPSEAREGRQTIGAAISEVLEQHGALSAAEIADRINASGRDTNNRAISYSLQALKKRGLVKSVDGKWVLKTRSRRGRPSTSGDAQEAMSEG